MYRKSKAWVFHDIAGQEEQFKEILACAWEYSHTDPMVLQLHLPDGKDRDQLTNTWIIGRELLAECVIDGKPHVGDGDILVLYGDTETTELSFSNEDTECFVISFSTKELKRVLDLTYLIRSRNEEAQYTMEKLEIELKDLMSQF